MLFPVFGLIMVFDMFVVCGVHRRGSTRSFVNLVAKTSRTSVSCHNLEVDLMDGLMEYWSW